MRHIQIRQVDSSEEASALDTLLWQVLWEPLGLPRDFRESLKVGGEALEYVMKQGSYLLGGLVGNRLSHTTAELQHLALLPEAQRQGMGTKLVKRFLRDMQAQGCSTIRTIARNTSVGFFEKMSFAVLAGDNPSHLAFLRQGITLVRMEYESKGRGGPPQRPAQKSPCDVM